MRSCSPRRPMRWNAATGAIARCKATSIVYERKRRSVRALRWTCGVKPRPHGVDKPSYHSNMHGLDKPGVFTTVSENDVYHRPTRGTPGEGLRLADARRLAVAPKRAGPWGA